LISKAKHNWEIIAVILIAALVVFNSLQILSVSAALGEKSIGGFSIGGGSGKSSTFKVKSGGDVVQNVIDAIIPKGTPVYGEELGVSYDEPVEVLLANGAASQWGSSPTGRQTDVPRTRTRAGAQGCPNREGGAHRQRVGGVGPKPQRHRRDGEGVGVSRADLTEVDRHAGQRAALALVAEDAAARGAAAHRRLARRPAVELDHAAGAAGRFAALGARDGRAEGDGVQGPADGGDHPRRHPARAGPDRPAGLLAQCLSRWHEHKPIKRINHMDTD